MLRDSTLSLMGQASSNISHKSWLTNPGYHLQEQSLGALAGTIDISPGFLTQNGVGTPLSPLPLWCLQLKGAC